MTKKSATHQHHEYDFTFVLSDDGELNDELENALYGHQCDDATISVRAGRVYVTFSRSANSIRDAILGAILDFQSCNVQASILRVNECNLVTQSEIARKIDRTRQLVYQYIRGDRGPGGFPPPVCDIVDGTPLYYWCEVASWLWDNDMITENVHRDAVDVAVINSVLELHHQKTHQPDLAKEVARLVATKAQTSG